MKLAMLAYTPLTPNTQLLPAQSTDPLWAGRQRPFATGKAIRVQLVALYESFLYMYIQWL